MAQNISSSDCLESDSVPTVKIKLGPLILKGFFKKSICKVARDECYSDFFLCWPTAGKFYENGTYSQAYFDWFNSGFEKLLVEYLTVTASNCL